MTLPKLPQYNGVLISYVKHFSPNGLAYVKKASQLFEQADAIFCGVKGRASQQKMGLWQAIDSNDRAALDNIGKEIGLNIQTLNHHRWQTQTKTSLDKKGLWDKMQKKVATCHSKKLDELKKEWFAHTDFATHSSEAINYLANNLIPHITDFLEGAKEALIEANYHLTKKQRFDAAQYLQALSDWIDTVRAALFEAMIKRLILASRHGDINFDDVCYDMVDKLKTLSALDEGFSLGTPSRHLSADCFNAFHHDIWRYASDKQKRQFQFQVSWLATDSEHHITSYQGEVIIQPRLFDDITDRNFITRGLDWLFGVTPPKAYLLEHRHLIAMARLSQQHAQVLSDAKQLDERLKKSEVLCDGIENVLMDNPIPQGVWQYLMPRAHTNTSVYRAYWHTHITHMQQQCLMILKKDIERMKGEAFIEQRIDISEQPLLRRLRVNRLIKRLNAVCPPAENADKTHQRLCRQHQRLLNANRGDDIVLKARLLKLEQGQVPTSSELKSLIKACNTKTKPKADIRLAIERALNGILPAYKKKMDSLKHRKLDDSELYELGLLTQALAHLPSQQARKKATKLFYALLYHYADKGEKQKATDKDKALWATAVENILLVQSGHFKEPRCQEDIRALKTARKQDATTYRQTCQRVKARLDTFHLNQVATDTLLQLKKLIWCSVAQKRQESSFQYLRGLYKKARRNQVTTLEQLNLSVFDENLLGLKDKPFEPIKSLNALLALERAYQDIDKGSKDAVNDFIKRCEGEIRLQQSRGTSATPTALSALPKAPTNLETNRQNASSGDTQYETVPTPTSSL